MVAIVACFTGELTGTDSYVKNGKEAPAPPVPDIDSSPLVKGVAHYLRSFSLPRDREIVPHIVNSSAKPGHRRQSSASSALEGNTGLLGSETKRGGGAPLTTALRPETSRRPLLSFSKTTAAPSFGGIGIGRD